MSIQVSIKKQDQITNQASFPTMEEAEAWVAYHQFSGDVRIEDISSQLEQEQTNADSMVFLASTDFQVLRHIRQKALGQELSLSEEEYLALEQQRADAAARIIR